MTTLWPEHSEYTNNPTEEVNPMDNTTNSGTGVSYTSDPSTWPINPVVWPSEAPIQFPPPPRTVTIVNPDDNAQVVRAYGYRQGDDNDELQRVMWDAMDATWVIDPDRAEWKPTQQGAEHPWKLCTVWPEAQREHHARVKLERRAADLERQTADLVRRAADLEHHLAIVVGVTRMMAAAFDIEVDGL